MMRKLIVISFLTLDGVMQAPGGKEEDTEGGFKYGGWQMPIIQGDDYALFDDVGKASALLLGRKTYDIFASYWPTIGKDIETWGPFMNNITKYVASKTLDKTEWQNSNLLEGDLAQAVTELKAEEGNDIYVFGSSDLSQSLMRENLIDEYLLLVHPIVLGMGKRLFQQGGPKQSLELVSSKTTKNGILVLKYKPTQ